MDSPSGFLLLPWWTWRAVSPGDSGPGVRFFAGWNRQKSACRCRSRIARYSTPKVSVSKTICLQAKGAAYRRLLGKELISHKATPREKGWLAGSAHGCGHGCTDDGTLGGTPPGPGGAWIAGLRRAKRRLLRGDNARGLSAARPAEPDDGEVRSSPSCLRPPLASLPPFEVFYICPLRAPQRKPVGSPLACPTRRPLQGLPAERLATPAIRR